MNGVPPVSDTIRKEQNLSDVVPAPTPPPEAPENDTFPSSPAAETPSVEPSDGGSPPTPMPMQETMIDPVSFVDPVGVQKASSVTSASLQMNLPIFEEHAVPFVEAEERTSLPSETLIRRRIQ